MRTTSGYPGFADRIPNEDAVAVARLRAAGAIIVGKTNLPTLASGIQSNNPVFGRTNNPYDATRTPGGSSGGAAAAVAAGLSYLDLGSDIGGSIRIPAHFCGVCGLKTTGGSIPGKGHISSVRPLELPHAWLPLLELPAFGPIARTVDDLKTGFRILTSRTEQTSGVVRNLRIAWTQAMGRAPITSEYAAHIRRAASILADTGF